MCQVTFNLVSVDRDVCDCSKWGLDLWFSFLSEILGLNCQRGLQTKMRCDVKLIFFVTI